MDNFAYDILRIVIIMTYMLYFETKYKVANDQ